MRIFILYLRIINILFMSIKQGPFVKYYFIKIFIVYQLFKYFWRAGADTARRTGGTKQGKKSENQVPLAGESFTPGAGRS